MEPTYHPLPNELSDIDHRFAHHPPQGTQASRYEDNRLACRDLAECILENCPPSRERSLALTKLEEVMFWMNEAIARNE